jgi:hypothetical protein
MTICAEVENLDVRGKKTKNNKIIKTNGLIVGNNRSYVTIKF